MKVRYYLSGIILIISCFVLFSLIGQFNTYSWMNVTIHYIVVIIGFMLLTLGIVSMILFLKNEKKMRNIIKLRRIIL